MRIYLPIIGFAIKHLIIRFTNALINMLCCALCFISSVLQLNLRFVFLQNASKLKAIRANNRSEICPRKWVKRCGGVQLYFDALLISAPDTDGWSGSRPHCLIPMEEAPVTTG